MEQNNNFTTKWIWLGSAVIIALMFSFSAWAWGQLPADASIPVHWNAVGEVDRYGGKIEGLLLLPLVSIGIVLLFILIRYIDPLRANIERSGQAYRAGLFVTLFLLAVLHGGAVLSAAGYGINIGRLTAPTVGLMFIVVGNYLGKIRRNYMFGVRTPWTLASELAWNKTHRVTGKLFVVSGILIVLASFWSPIVAFYTMMVTILGAVLFALIYSYLVWKRDPTVQTAQEVR